MKQYQITVAQWSMQDVQNWLAEIGLGNLNGAIQHNAVSGNDLIELAQEDLLADLGATTIQARKVKSELAKLGAPITQARSGGAGDGGYGYPPASGYPVPAYPPPSGYKVQETGAKKSSEVADFKKQLEEEAKAAKMTEMERMLREEKMKNDMRKEMDMTSRLAATEAAQRSGSGGSGMVVNNNNSNAAAAAGGGGGGGGGGSGGGLQARGPTQVVVREDDYCCCCW